MIEHGVVQSTVRPQELNIDANSVWVAENIEAIKKESEEGSFEGFRYRLTQYSKDEYIQQLDMRDKMKSDAILELSDLIADLMGGD